MIINFRTTNLLRIILALQLAIFGLIGLDISGIKIPILRQIVSFIYLTFIPGILILNIVRLWNKLNPIEVILYSVGLSLSLLMFTGALINFLYPLFGVTNPISEISLILTISVIVLFLCFISYMRDKNYSTSASFSINTKKVLSPFTLFLLLLIFLSVFGAHLLNFYNKNLLLLFFLVIISLIPVLVAFDKLPEEGYPFAIWVISISLLLHTSLISTYLSNLGDADVSFYESQLVTVNNYWDLTNPTPMNSMLSIKMLLPIYSIILNLNLIWIYKIVYPLLYSFTPLIAYIVYKKLKFSSRVAFLSACYLMFIFPFFTILQANVRTGVAELFLSLLMLVIVSKDISPSKMTFLAIIFCMSIAVSHYGVSYIFLVVLFFSLPLLLWYKKADRKERINLLSVNFVALYIVFLLSWYMYTSASTTFNLLINFSNNFVYQLHQEFISASQLGFGKDLPLSITVARDILIILGLFIGIGMISLVYQMLKRSIKLDIEYASLSIIFFGVALSIFLPTESFAAERVWHVSSVVLAPFHIVGITKSLQLFEKIVGRNYVVENVSLWFFSIFLLVLLLFNSGFISEAILKDGDYSPSKLIHKSRWTYINDSLFIYEFYRSYYPEVDIYSAKWLCKKGDTTKKICADGGRFILGAGPLKTCMPLSNFRLINNNIPAKREYIYLRYLNVVENKIIEKEDPLTISNTNKINYILSNSNKIYTNNGSEIYYR